MAAHTEEECTNADWLAMEGACLLVSLFGTAPDEPLVIAGARRAGGCMRAVVRRRVRRHFVGRPCILHVPITRPPRQLCPSVTHNTGEPDELASLPSKLAERSKVVLRREHARVVREDLMASELTRDLLTSDQVEALAAAPPRFLRPEQAGGRTFWMPAWATLSAGAAAGAPAPGASSATFGVVPGKEGLLSIR